MDCGSSEIKILKERNRMIQFINAHPALVVAGVAFVVAVFISAMIVGYALTKVKTCDDCG